MATSPVVAVIHATPASMAPVRAAFAECCPQADLWHLLDDRLDRDAAAAGGLTDELTGRMTRLIEYAVGADADVVQLACSMFAPVATSAVQPVPVVASDQGMFDEIARRRPGRVLVVASIPPAGVDSTDRLRAYLDSVGQAPTIETAVVEEARAATLAGDVGRLVSLLSDAYRGVPDVDVVMLAQYSLSPAASWMTAELGVPVLSGPDLAARKLARELAAVVEGRSEEQHR